MTKKEGFKKAYEAAKENGAVDLVILYLHMPDGSQEIIVNDNPEAKVGYVETTYSDDLVHKNSDQIYITDYIFTDGFDDGIDIGGAMDILKDGGIVTRKGWNGKGMYLYYVPASEYAPCTKAARREFDGNPVPYRAYIAMKTVDGDIVPWVASQSDLLANDWVDLTPEEDDEDEEADEAENGDSK